MDSQTQKVRLVAICRQQYAGRSLRSGDEFQAPEAVAEQLVASRLARRVSGALGRRAGHYLRRDMRAIKT